jgi:uncharacterized phage protein (TIGR01671 family)
MREYKFRGKCVERDKWVYGCYVKGVQEDKAYILKNHDGYWSWSDIWFVVYPETVGQFTGLHDKNGREIYEGDILRDTDNEIYYVDFIRGCFYLKTKYISFPHLGWTEWLPMCEIDRLANPVDFEIIGNIYENPDLLSAGVGE